MSWLGVSLSWFSALLRGFPNILSVPYFFMGFVFNTHTPRSDVTHKNVGVSHWATPTR